MSYFLQTGKLEDDARQREAERRQEKEKEEPRRRAQRELKRRIEEQIKRESEISAKKLSQANERLKQNEILRGQEFHQQTHIIQQPLEVYTVDRDEVPVVTFFSLQTNTITTIIIGYHCSLRFQKNEGNKNEMGQLFD